MNKMKVYFKKKKYLLLFLAVLMLCGLLVGLLLGITNIDFLKENVLYYSSHIENQHLSYCFFHFFLLVISLATSFFGIGIPLLCAILFYEGLTIGFLIGIFSFTYFIGGFIFSIIFLLFSKLPYLFLFILFILKCFEIARKMIGKYLYKTDPSLAVSNLLKACICIILLVLLYDTFLYFIGNKILPLFDFLLS